MKFYIKYVYINVHYDDGVVYAHCALFSDRELYIIM